MYKTIILSLFLFLVHQANLVAQENELYIKAGSLYNSEQNLLLENKIIHIKENKIVSIAEENSLPLTAEILDLSEYTVLPGLIDAHTHEVGS